MRTPHAAFPHYLISNLCKISSDCLPYFSLIFPPKKSAIFCGKPSYEIRRSTSGFVARLRFGASWIAFTQARTSNPSLPKQNCKLRTWAALEERASGWFEPCIRFEFSLNVSPKCIFHHLIHQDWSLTGGRESKALQSESFPLKSHSRDCHVHWHRTVTVGGKAISVGCKIWNWAPNCSRKLVSVTK